MRWVNTIVSILPLLTRRLFLHARPKTFTHISGLYSSARGLAFFLLVLADGAETRFVMGGPGPSPLDESSKRSTAQCV